MKMVRSEDLVYEYVKRDEEGNVTGTHRAIDHVDIDAEEGQFIAVLGHNGSGKSTFAKHLNVLLSPTEGAVWVDGKDTRQMEELWNIRQSAGMVFQNPDNQIIGTIVEEDVGFGPENLGVPTKEIWNRVKESLKAVGMYEHRKESPNKLSGGQKRRVAIAGVISMRPGVLILDEPTAGLDPAGCKKILETICDYREKTGSTVVIVSHSMDDVARIADRLIVFNHGSIRFDGTPEEVFSNPKELSDIGLSVPAPTQIAAALREQGARIEGSIYTIEQLLAALLKLKKEAGRNA